MGNRGKRPKRKADAPSIQPAPATNYDEATPKFCLHHIHHGHSVAKLPPNLRADFAVALERFAELTWRDIKLMGRHSFGSEWMRKDRIHPDVPEKFKDEDRFMVLRYSGNLPMVGVRILDVFHVLWIEANYGDVYNHGSK